VYESVTIPTHVPANGLDGPLGCASLLLLPDSAVSPSRGRFDFEFAFAVADGVGVPGISSTGAGNRSATINSKMPLTLHRIIRRTILMRKI
jgi:hypothetical protein